MTATAQLVKYRVLIQGLPPGLMFQGKGLMEWSADNTPKDKKKLTRDDEARLLCHWTRQGKKDSPALPSVMLYKSICEAAKGHKVGRKTAAQLVASTLSFDQERYPIGGPGYEAFVDWVRIPPRTGAMVQMGRPLFKEWSCEVVLVVDAEEYGKSPEDILRPILRDAGKLIGIGANRPSLKGPYGKFIIAEFGEL